MDKYDVIIIGKGPAGISASLYTVRAGVSTAVIGKDGGALEKVKKIENYYGFAEPVSGEELYKSGIANAERLGAHIIEDEVFDINAENDCFRVTGKDREYTASSVIIAAGTGRKTPPLAGLKEYEGKGVSYCAVCDAFFYRNLKTVVIGNSEYAVHEAEHLKGTSLSVAILTNGEKMNAAVPDDISLDTREIERIEGGDLVTGVRFKDGSAIDTDGVFIAIGTASSSDLAKKLGIADPEGRIMVQPDMSTFVPGLFAAGDCTGGMLQVAKAVYEGALAGTGAVKYVKSKKI